jgi:tRNA 2-thiouridine synthesizing protein A
MIAELKPTKIPPGDRQVMPITHLDLKGLSCPLPVLRTNKATKQLIPGDILEVLVTDPNAPKDFKIFCENTGHDLVSCEEHDGVYTIILKKDG